MDLPTEQEFQYEVPVGSEVLVLVRLVLAVNSLAVWCGKLYPLHGVYQGVHKPKGIDVEPMIVVTEDDGSHWYLLLDHIDGFQVGARGAS